MKSISVHASTQYQIIVGTDLLGDAGNYIKAVHKCCNVAIISDSNVWPIYGSIIQNSLKDSGYKTYVYVFQAGEASKNTETYLGILNFLSKSQISRSDIIVALGGGVVGDITGFAAATYLRGIAYVQIPTSLLAMVDSSVGGKTAIDLPAGKNLVGAFKQPSLVLCDVSVLTTLPKYQFQDGCAEIIKYGMLYDAGLLHHLSKVGANFDPEMVVSQCITFKRDVVEQDEFDTGIRQKLNFGHTIGHGIELCSNYQVSHGHAVAAGMAIVTRAAAATGMCNPALCTLLEKILRAFDLPVESEYSAEQLFQSALSDKKRSGSSVNLIVPRDTGICEIVPMPVSELKSFIKAGL